MFKFVTALLASTAVAYRTRRSNVNTFRLANAGLLAEDTTYTMVRLTPSLDTTAGKENRFARMYLMGEAEAPGDDTPDGLTFLWFYGRRLAPDAPAPTIYVREVHNFDEGCDYYGLDPLEQDELAGDVIDIGDFAAAAIADKDGECAGESDIPMDIQTEATRDIWDSARTSRTPEEQEEHSHYVAVIEMAPVDGGDDEIIACGEFRRSTQRTVLRYMDRIFVPKGALTPSALLDAILNP